MQLPHSADYFPRELSFDLEVGRLAVAVAEPKICKYVAAAAGDARTCRSFSVSTGLHCHYGKSTILTNSCDYRLGSDRAKSHLADLLPILRPTDFHLQRHR